MKRALLLADIYIEDQRYIGALMHSDLKKSDMRSVSRVSRMAAAAMALALALLIIIPFSATTRALAATPAVSSYSQNIDMPETGQAFTYAQITDLHIGYGVGDYGTAGFDDAPPSGDIGSPAQNLRSTVDWINANHESMSMQFVVVTGDITDSAEKSEFMKAKEILDTLQVPYVPIPGNHDMWPHTASAECNEPCGDQYFKGIFDNRFETLRSLFPGWDEGTRTTPIWNGEADTLAGPDKGCYSYFQNFAFDYAGYHFVFCDFNSRDYRSQPLADLFDSALCRGTWAWFKEHFKTYPYKAAENVITFSHEAIMVVPGHGFDSSEYDTITGFLADGFNETYMGLAVAGHQHTTQQYDITYGSEYICPGILTSANRDGTGNVREFTVYGKTSEKDARGLILYSERGFSGRGELFTGDDSSLASNYVGNDTVSSLRVVRGGSGTLYEGESFEGKSVAAGSDMSDLSSVGFDDVTSSLSFVPVEPVDTSGTWYLAEGSTGGDFETWVLVQNPGDEAANVKMTYMTDSGEIKGPEFSLGAGRRKSINVADTVPGTWEVSTKVETSVPVVAERAMYWNGRRGGSESIGVSELAGTWYLAEGSTGGDFETWVLVQNPGDEAANVKMTYMTDSGEIKGPEFSLGAGRRKSINVADTVPGTWEVSTKVETSVPVVAERAMYWNGRTEGSLSIGLGY